MAAPTFQGPTFQELIQRLNAYWAAQGCVILQPYDLEMGAGTFHTATTLRALGPDPWNAAFVLMIIGNVLTIYVPGLPLWSSLVIAFAARNSAAYFTTWYPQYRKAKYGTPPANALPGTH